MFLFLRRIKISGKSVKIIKVYIMGKNYMRLVKEKVINWRTSMKLVGK